MKPNRIYFYDIVKSIASYLICLSHFGTVDVDVLHNPAPYVYFNYFFLGIASVGVPIFLMTNGAFLLNKDYPLRKILHRAKSFGLLYLIWGAITLLALAPLYNDHYSTREFILALFTTGRSRTEHLWFMMTMIYIYLLFPFLKALYDKPAPVYTKYLFGLIFTCTFGFELLDDLASTSGYLLGSNTMKQFAVQSFLWFNPFNFNFAFTLVYFVGGGLLAKHLELIRVKPVVLWLCMLLSLLLLFLFCLARTYLTGEKYDIVWSSQDTIMTMIMSGSLFILSSRIRLNNQTLITMSRVLGLNTLGIYFIHIPLGHWLTPLYKNLEVSNYLLADMLYALLLMLGSLGISLLLRQIPLAKKLVQIG